MPTGQQFAVSVVGGGSANLKDTPANDAKTVVQLPPGSTVQTIGPSMTVDGVTWLPVTAAQASGSATGWIRLDNVAASDPAAVPTATTFVAQYVATPTKFPTFTPVPPATLAPTRRPTLPAAPLTNTWTDPQGRLTLRYPATWKVENQSIYALSLDGPDSSVLSIRITNPPREPTLDAVLQAEQSQIKNNFSNTVFTPTQDLTVGGKPGKYWSETYGDNLRGEEWIVFAGGAEYDFGVGKFDVNAGDIEQIIASVKFA